MKRHPATCGTPAPLRRMFGVGLLCLLGWGCAGTYSEKSTGMRQSYRTGNFNQALNQVDEIAVRPQDRSLAKLERGNLLLSAGKPEESERVLAEVIEPYIFEKDYGPVIQLGGVGSQVMSSTLGDDRSMSYRIPGYEIVMAMNYRALAFLFMGNMDSAVVEMRRAARIQESIFQAYREEISGSSQEKGVLNDKVAELMAGMDEVLQGSSGSWNNAYVWWLSGVLREANGEASVAQIDYQRAFEINRTNSVFRNDLFRLLRRNDPERYRMLRTEFPDTVIQDPAKGSASVVVIYEESLISQLYPDTFVMFWPGLHTLNITVPYYRDSLYRPSSLRVRNGTQQVALEEGTSLQALAYHRLQEQMNGIIWRNIVRNVSRAAANEASEQGNENWEAAIKIFSAVKGLIEEADTRSWSTLPMTIQVGRIWVEPGEQRFYIDSRLGKMGPFEFQIQPGETGVLFVRDTGGFTGQYVSTVQSRTPAVYRNEGTTSEPWETAAASTLPTPQPENGEHQQ